MKNNVEDLQVKAYEDKIGMTKIIETAKEYYLNNSGKNGKYWMALSPYSYEWGKKSKHPIAYWVNYGDNETYGWFTVEQIKQWLTTPELKLHTLGGVKER